MTNFYKTQKFQEKKKQSTKNQDYNYNKVFLFVAFKVYSFEHEIKQFLGLDSEVKKVLKKLVQQGYLLTKRFSDLHIEFQQIEFQINSDKKRNWNENSTVYQVTQKGKIKANEIYEQVKVKYVNDETIQTFLQDCFNFRLAKTKKLKELQKLEKDSYMRTYKTFDGIEYELPTKKALELETNRLQNQQERKLKELKQNKIYELMVQNNQLAIKNKNELQLLAQENIIDKYDPIKDKQNLVKSNKKLVDLEKFDKEVKQAKEIKGNKEFDLEIDKKEKMNLVECLTYTDEKNERLALERLKLLGF